MPNRDLPVSDMQVLALDVKVAFAEAALVTEVRGLSPGPATAVDEAQGAGRGLVAACPRRLPRLSGHAPDSHN